MKKQNIPVVTVLMSCYNGERWLAEAINSVLVQTYTDFEFVIVDDGSNDNTLDIIQWHEKVDSRIKVITKLNTGLADSLNVGIFQARGQWIARLDQDDLCELDRLAEQMSFIKKNPDVVLLGTGSLEIEDSGRVIQSHTYPDKHQSLVHNLVSCKRFFPHSSAFYHTATVQRLGGYRPRIGWADDRDLWLRLSEHGQLACLNKPFVRFRRHTNQMTLVEGGRRSIIDSRIGMVSFFLRKIGCFDPVEADVNEWTKFRSWIENRLEQEGVFKLRDVWASARAVFFCNNNRLYGGLHFAWELLRSWHVYQLLKEKIVGSDLPAQLAQEWKEKNIDGEKV